MQAIANHKAAQAQQRAGFFSSVIELQSRAGGSKWQQLCAKRCHMLSMRLAYQLS